MEDQHQEEQDREFKVKLRQVRFYLDQLEAERSVPSKRMGEFFETLCSIHSRFAEVVYEPSTLYEKADRTGFFLLGVCCTVCLQILFTFMFAKGEVLQFQHWIRTLIA